MTPRRAGLGFNPEEVLFVGQGRSTPAWYRCYLPAMFMGADWIGLEGDLSDGGKVTTGERRREDLADYRVIVLQQPRDFWQPIVMALRERGIKVVVEHDDFLHGIARMDDHAYRQGFSKKRIKGYELMMSMADALICSTEYIARRYRRFNKRAYLCENGLDLSRYALTRPERATVNIGWAGATGHKQAAFPWLHAVGDVLARHPETCFVSIGQDFANGFLPVFGPTRAMSVPFSPLDNYPAAMCHMDIALAPAGRGNFFRGKSDLRWLEASALGIPVVADPEVYWRIEDGVDGLLATTPQEAAAALELLVGDPELRQELGETARSYVREHRRMEVAVGQWVEAIGDVLAR